MKSSSDLKSLTNSHAEERLAQLELTKIQAEKSFLSMQLLLADTSEELKPKVAAMVKQAKENFAAAEANLNQFLEMEEKRRDVLVLFVMGYLGDLRKNKFAGDDAVIVKAYLAAHFADAAYLVQKLQELNEHQQTSLEGASTNIVKMTGGMLLSSVEKHLREHKSIESKIDRLFPHYSQAAGQSSVVINTPTPGKK